MLEMLKMVDKLVWFVRYSDSIKALLFKFVLFFIKTVLTTERETTEAITQTTKTQTTATETNGKSTVSDCICFIGF